jgi:hypothetical protein
VPRSAAIVGSEGRKIVIANWLLIIIATSSGIGAAREAAFI